MSDNWGFETKQIHVGGEPDPTTGARAVPIYQTTSYQFRDTDHAANLFGLAEIGNIYTRIMNPTQAAFEARVNALEGGCTTAVGLPGTLAVASGQAAETLAFMTLCESGDHVVASPSLYGGTYNLLHYTLPKFGVEVTFVDDPARPRPVGSRDPAEHQGVLRRDHPQPEERRVRHRGRRRGRPRERHPADGRQHRADAVPDPPARVGRRHRGPQPHQVHGWPRHLDRRRDRRRRHVRLRRIGRFPNFTEPDPSYHGLAYFPALGHGAFILKARVQMLRDMGMAISPFNAFLILQGLETLSLRMERHFSNAQVVAEFLDAHDAGRVGPLRRAAVEPVARAGQEARWRPRATARSSRSRSRAASRPARSSSKASTLHSHVANIGDVRSLVIHPASTTHSQLTPEEQAASDVTPGLVRLSVGLESIDDIIADLEQAFAAATA